MSLLAYDTTGGLCVMLALKAKGDALKTKKKRFLKLALVISTSTSLDIPRIVC